MKIFLTNRIESIFLTILVIRGKLKESGDPVKLPFQKNIERNPEKDNKEKITKEGVYDDDLLRDIAITKTALDAAYSNFENVVDPDLIDCYIHEVIAVQKRYKFLLKHAKKNEEL